MNAVLTRFVILSTVVVALVLSLSPIVVLAESCVVAKIAILAGTWEQTDTKTSYMVQTQDSAGTACKISETLHLSFEISGAGTLTGSTGDPMQQVSMSKNTANRNFYYQHVVGATAAITVKAGVWQTSLNTSDSVSATKKDTPPDSVSATTEAVKVQTKEQKSTIASTTGSAAITQTSTSTQTSTVSTASSSSSTVARSEMAIVPLPPVEQNQTQKNEQPVSPPKKVDTTKTTLAPTRPSVSKPKIQPEDSASTTSSLEVSGEVISTTPEQFAAGATSEQTGNTSSGWVATAGFVGVLLMGILALYVHKIV